MNAGPHKEDKPLLDFQAIENWVSLGDDGDLSASHDGNYIAYSIRNSIYRERDSIIVQAAKNSWRQAFASTNPGFFSGDSKQYIFQDRTGLCFLQLGTDERPYVKDVESYQLPSDGKNKWLAYQLNDKERTLILQNLLTGKQKSFARVASYSFNGNGEWLICQLADGSKGMVAYHLSTGKESRFTSVAGYLFDGAGQSLLVSMYKNESRKVATLEYIRFPDGTPNIIWSDSDTNTRIGGYNFDHSGKQVVFMVQSILKDELQSQNSIWYWQLGMDKAAMKVNNQTTGIDAGLLIYGPLYITNKGRYIKFSLHSPPTVPRSPYPDAAKVDVWSYKDTVLHSAQPLLNSTNEIEAIVDTGGSRVICLNDDEHLINPIKFDCDLAVLVKKREKADGDRFWQEDYHLDSNWLLSLKDGSRKFIGRGNTNDIHIFRSPNDRYVVYFDLEQGCHYFSYNLVTGKVTKISAGVPMGQLGAESFSMSIRENPTIKAGIAAWLEGDAGVLVYDGYDIWQLDLEGKRPPVNITNGYGRQHKTIFTLLGSNRIDDIEFPIVREGESLLLKAFNVTNKYSGFYRKVLGKQSDPEKLCFEPYMLDMLVYSGDGKAYQAADNIKYIVKRQSATQAPNYFLTTDFRTYNPISNIQPQNRYNWLSAELHSFKQMDGTFSQGILYKPENFDPAKKYPVIISFYATLTDKMYQYPTPGYLDAPEIFTNPSWFVSHGYMVFLPDIYFFSKGKWGPSVLNTLDGAARYLRTLSFVDGAHLGASGHSNSGRFGYYVLTHSRSFSAMSVGAGTSDMISFALSDNEGKGMSSRLMILEETAVGGGMGSIWQNKDTWLDQTAVLHTDKVSCPVLMFHNKKDGVPVEQAAEMFIALRRLEKKAWWLQYDEERHRLFTPRNVKDYTIRFTQFFDHYLKGAPPPSWMTQGIPNQLKGVVAKYELDPQGSCGIDCKVCQERKWSVEQK